MTKLIQIFSLCLLFAALSSCHKDSNPSSNSLRASDIVPLTVGNIWIWNVTTYDTLGQTRESCLDSLVIERDTSAGGITWYTHREHGHDVGYANRTTGLWIRLLSSTDPPDPYLYYKFFAFARDSFRYPIITYAGYSAWLNTTAALATVQSADTLVVVPAGTFHCVAYEVTFDFEPNRTDLYFLAPGVGFIKSEGYATLESGLTFRGTATELTAFISGQTQ